MVGPFSGLKFHLKSAFGYELSWIFYSSKDKGWLAPSISFLRFWKVNSSSSQGEHFGQSEHWSRVFWIIKGILKALRPSWKEMSSLLNGARKKGFGGSWLRGNGKLMSSPSAVRQLSPRSGWLDSLHTDVLSFLNSIMGRRLPQTGSPVAPACGLAVSGPTVSYVISSSRMKRLELCRLGVACFGAKRNGVHAVLALFISRGHSLRSLPRKSKGCYPIDARSSVIPAWTCFR